MNIRKKTRLGQINKMQLQKSYDVCSTSAKKNKKQITTTHTQKKEENDIKAIMSRHNMLSDIKIKINQVV